MSAGPSPHDVVREIVLSLPGVTEGLCYRTPGFRVRGKLFARFHQDGASLVLHAGPDRRETLLDSAPRVFYLTDHYVGHPWVLVRLRTVSRAVLREVLEQAWRERAPATLVRKLDARD